MVGWRGRDGVLVRRWEGGNVGWWNGVMVDDGMVGCCDGGVAGMVGWWDGGMVERWDGVLVHDGMAGWCDVWMVGWWGGGVVGVVGC